MTTLAMGETKVVVAAAVKPAPALLVATASCDLGLHDAADPVGVTGLSTLQRSLLGTAPDGAATVGAVLTPARDSDEICVDLAARAGQLITRSTPPVVPVLGLPPWQKTCLRAIGQSAPIELA
jgi:hypothetical protein